jgi:hypothetical protein
MAAGSRKLLPEVLILQALKRSHRAFLLMHERAAHATVKWWQTVSVDAGNCLLGQALRLLSPRYQADCAKVRSPERQQRPWHI